MSTPKLSGTCLLLATLAMTAPGMARAEGLAAATVSGSLHADSCADKTATLSKPGSVSASNSCVNGTATAEAKAAIANAAVSTSQRTAAGTSSASTNGSVGVTFYFEVVGPGTASVPVNAVLTGTLAASGSGGESSLTLIAGNATPVFYYCGIKIPVVKCGGISTKLTAMVTPVHAVAQSLAAPVEITAAVLGSSSHGVGTGTDTSSATGKVSLSIPQTFPHASEYRLVISPGVAN
jgi:hypothetical protein